MRLFEFETKLTLSEIEERLYPFYGSNRTIP